MSGSGPPLGYLMSAPQGHGAWQPLPAGGSRVLQGTAEPPPQPGPLHSSPLQVAQVMLQNQPNLLMYSPSVLQVGRVGWGVAHSPWGLSGVL